jgi:hypothetical protein
MDQLIHPESHSPRIVLQAKLQRELPSNALPKRPSLFGEGLRAISVSLSTILDAGSSA